jgi:regulator of sigma E protease
LIDFLQTAAAFVAAIGILVTVHEFGHFWVARRLGVKVLRFSVGFGRPLLKVTRGPDRTEYVLAAIPLGGYVKMLDEREEPVPEHELDRAFNRKSLGVRIAVVVAGPLANFIFAVFCYWLMFVMGISGLKAIVGDVTPDSLAAQAGLASDVSIVSVEGRDVNTWEGVVQAVITEALDESRPLAIGVVDEQGRASSHALDLTGVIVDDLTQGQFFSAIGVTPARPPVPALIGELTPGSVAERSGLRSGDRVIRVDDEPIERWASLVAAIQAHPDTPVLVTVMRDGRTVALPMTPALVETDGGPIGRIGAGPKRVPEIYERYYVTERYGPWDALRMGAEKTYEITTLTLGVFWKIVRLELSVKNLSGPISIAQFAGYSADIGLARFLGFLALVSVSLGVLNLLPIPVLDGGHLLYYVLEFFKGSPVSEQSQMVGQQLGIAVLVGLMSVAFYNDIARLLG